MHITDQRLYNYIDTKVFVSVPLKHDSRWVHRHSLCLSADPLLVCYFLGVVNFVRIPEFLAIELSIKFAKYANIRLSIEQFLDRVVMENEKETSPSKHLSKK